MSAWRFTSRKAGPGAGLPSRHDSAALIEHTLLIGMITAVAIFVIGPIAQKVTARFDALSTALVAMGPVDHNTAIAQTTGATGSAGQQTSVSAFINTNSGTSIGSGSTQSRGPRFRYLSEVRARGR
ncbi:MAG: hypothetical protein P8X75_13860 [Limibacillus sp.]